MRGIPTITELEPEHEAELGPDVATRVKELLRQATWRPLTAEEKIFLLKAAYIYGEVNETPSVRNVDWYGTFGR